MHNMSNETAKRHNDLLTKILSNEEELDKKL